MTKKFPGRYGMFNGYAASRSAKTQGMPVYSDDGDDIADTLIPLERSCLHIKSLSLATILDGVDPPSGESS